jgi:hypothetical protein
MNVPDQAMKTLVSIMKWSAPTFDDFYDILDQLDEIEGSEEYHEFLFETRLAAEREEAEMKNG